MSEPSLSTKAEPARMRPLQTTTNRPQPTRQPPPKAHPDPTIITLFPGKLSSERASSEVMACSAPGMSILVA